MSECFAQLLGERGTVQIVVVLAEVAAADAPHAPVCRLLELPAPEADVLGNVTWQGNALEVSKAYRRLSVLVHPDKNPGEDARKAFEALNEAHRVLKDTDKRVGTADLRAKGLAGVGQEHWAPCSLTGAAHLGITHLDREGSAHPSWHPKPRMPSALLDALPVPLAPLPKPSGHAAEGASGGGPEQAACQGGMCDS